MWFDLVKPHVFVIPGVGVKKGLGEKNTGHPAANQRAAGGPESHQKGCPGKRPEDGEQGVSGQASHSLAIRLRDRRGQGNPGTGA